MEYFIFMKDETICDPPDDTHLLGEDTGFGVFWTGSGWDIFNDIINKHPRMLKKILILDNKKNEYSALQFLDKIKDLKIKMNE